MAYRMDYDMILSLPINGISYLLNGNIKLLILIEISIISIKC